MAMDESFVFAQTAKQMELNVIQVQQWLTDISATRGLDGLNDGFDEAASSRDSFLEGAAAFEKMYREENDAESLAKLTVLTTAFEGYYEEGRKMAQGYIDDGPATGNKMMGDFDTAAATMAGEEPPSGGPAMVATSSSTFIR